MQVKDITLFEKLNPMISINLFMLELIGSTNEFKTVPCYLSESKKDKHFNLLYVEEYYEEDEYIIKAPTNYHYV